ncbi:YccS family putative transporter [Halomonas korlensis]|uniref:TIGR01666 family membrane protein n=1 Tax=Halomonas korlensis TaxID=463301 RepID=A0A1I7GLJ6_9GAMM|nr:YccS family putative transporter [Halomonas korlensis]SFU49289.1 TIGR01666 family membrane protein [Halomonas korlensis]
MRLPLLSAPLSLTLRRLWTLDTFAYALRVFVAFSGALAVSSWQADVTLMMPLFLGIIASALAETDDSWQGRLQAVGVTLACFAMASLSVQWLFPHPWLFAPALMLSTFVLIMLGALGPRYATISFATLILAIYSMIALDHHGGVPEEGAWRQPLLLLSGAAWYGLISVVWCALFSRQPVKQSLARVYRRLGRYLSLKATLFEPLRGRDLEATRLALAHQNGEVVAALNQAKEVLFQRLGSPRGDRRLDRYLQLYFIAQDIHERASSSHSPYSSLIEAFFHHDVLFRCQRLLDQQGHACRRLGRALLLNRPFEHDQSEQALEDLRASIDHLQAHQQPEWQALMPPLTALADNLATLEAQLASAEHPEVAAPHADASLHDRSLHGPRDAWTRIRATLTLSSPTLRHALRLPIALLVGYILMQVFHPTQGFWILLTTLFVCRPNFAATQRYLVERIAGTVLGLVVGWATITLFPQPMAQSLIAVVAGVVFFASRQTHYVIATAAITLLVLCSFNQVGDGFDLIWPRLFDTLVGVLIAALAVLWILPDWQGRRLYRQVAASLVSQRRYLEEIIQQYATGKQDDLAYRLARRNAHNADAALSTLLSNMLREPRRYQGHDVDNAMRFLALSHTLLGYLSALGAHRHAHTDDTAIDPSDDESDADVTALAERVAVLLGRLAEHLEARRPLSGFEAEVARLREALDAPETSKTDDGETYWPMRHQLRLMCRQLEFLGEAANRLIASAQRDRPEQAAKAYT